MSLLDRRKALFSAAASIIIVVIFGIGLIIHSNASYEENLAMAVLESYSSLESSDNFELTAVQNNDLEVYVPLAFGEEPVTLTDNLTEVIVKEDGIITSTNLDTETSQEVIVGEFNSNYNILANEANWLFLIEHDDLEFNDKTLCFSGTNDEISDAYLDTVINQVAELLAPVEGDETITNIDSVDSEGKYVFSFCLSQENELESMEITKGEPTRINVVLEGKTVDQIREANEILGRPIPKNTGYYELREYSRKITIDSLEHPEISTSKLMLLLESFFD